MDANLSKLKEVEDWLVMSHSCVLAEEVDRAAGEIKRLRASQFRWIPISERVPEAVIGHSSDQVFFWGVPLNNVVVARACSRPYGATHWAPVPPLPEKSQEEKDDEMLRAWIKEIGVEHSSQENTLRIGYLQGLKAAREQKAP